MNVYDSDKISDLLVHHYSMTRTEDPNNADILILNTCSIREKAQEKVFSELGRWKKIKQARPGTLIAVGGCVASQEGRALKQRAIVDNNSDLLKFSENLENICIDTIDNGFMTKDLALMCGPEQKWITTNEFFDIIKNKIEN